MAFQVGWLWTQAVAFASITQDEDVMWSTVQIPHELPHEETHHEQLLSALHDFASEYLPRHASSGALVQLRAVAPPPHPPLHADDEHPTGQEQTPCHILVGTLQLKWQSPRPRRLREGEQGGWPKWPSSLLKRKFSF